MTRDKALQFVSELENQFDKKVIEVEKGLTVELLKLHALFFAMENEKYGEKLTKLATREELRDLRGSVKEVIYSLYSMLENMEPSLSNVFLNDTFKSIDEATLYKLVVLIERYGLTKAEYQNNQAVVGFFNTLIEEVIASSKGYGYDFTPDGLIQLMIQSLKPMKGSVYDGTAGIANILVSAYKYAKEQGKDITVYGQEMNKELYVIAKLNLFINNILPENGDIQLGDTIRDPKWLENGCVMQFDYIMMNFPFGVRDWGYEFAVNDPYHRFELYDRPPKSQGDYAFILHALASLKKEGKAALIVPFGTLVRGAVEERIRKAMLKDDVIESIISLPTNLFSGTGIQVALLILNKNKQNHKKGRVQFINAEGDYERTRTQKYLKPEHIHKIIETLEAYENRERYSRIVSIDEIAENNGVLNPALYFVNVELDTEFGKVVFNKKKYESEAKNLVQIGEIAEVIRGVNLPSRRQIENPDGELFPVIQIRDIENGEIQFEKIEKLPIQTRDIQRVTAQPGDILVSSRGTQQKIAIVPEYDGTILVSNMFIIIRLHSDQEINPIYIKRFLESPIGQYFFEAHQSGSIATVLTPNDIKSIELPLLSIEQQNEMIKQLEDADELIRKAYEERKKQYFDAYKKFGIGDFIRQMEE
ncbi:N-6 DNA methylase [Anoxybacillus flavithermus]|uniref:site-specific DNA-methyltransferase (adenine-specific) n=1 Tax=Anoxybacillus flavithermus TaxID=33934 RepID=A0AAX1ZY79_9BACL|nr:N-6 DNA methylase [Anoxybacillus flavithermus]MBE2924152.1 N-6 DNA methylase [Anoxybacillus flavithermus]MBE2926797.1 N-6 DNA methylase [Anoxybacillus flavithermus]MBE2935117.1 N-6 DNA methylase [Anoxybacillus flavithermus]MBE2937608.1 N-6 DNA methylase [Anoxybacillus flavithermus]MBE2945335.1 N-6 DNA methylase [Anoxybacillus flavithermus]